MNLFSIITLLSLALCAFTFPNPPNQFNAQVRVTDSTHGVSFKAGIHFDYGQKRAAIDYGKNDYGFPEVAVTDCDHGNIFSYDTNSSCSVFCESGENCFGDGPCNCDIQDIWILLELSQNMGTCQMGDKSGTKWVYEDNTQETKFSFCMNEDTPLWINTAQETTQLNSTTYFDSFKDEVPDAHFFAMPDNCSCEAPEEKRTVSKQKSPLDILFKK